MSLHVIEGGKNRPYAVAEINSDDDHPDPGHFTELVIVHRKTTPTMTASGMVPTQAIVTPPFAIGDRQIADAFCKALNDFHQHWEEFDWDAHDMEQPAPVFRGEPE